MIMRVLLVCATVLMATNLTVATTAGATVQQPYDVVVYGGTSAGVAAAVQAARMGQSVVLIAPSRPIGGLTSSGLGHTDWGRRDTIGGVSLEFYERVRAYYDDPAKWVHEDREDYLGTQHLPVDYPGMWGFEPHAAEAVFEAWLAEEDIPVLRDERLILDRDRGIERYGVRIMAVRMESGLRVPGRMFIDATYEGDLLAMAGVSYTVGREPNAQYREVYNGVQKARTHNHVLVDPRFWESERTPDAPPEWALTEGVDPYVVPGDPASGLLPGVHGDDPGEEGAGDHRVQAYCYRLCLTDAPVNQVPFSKPDNYDEQTYELLFRNFEAGEERIPWLPQRMPNRKNDTNNRWGVSSNLIGGNYDYPEGDYETRARIEQAHRDYQMGFMWTLANHPRVPEAIRAEVSQWGLPRDEFVDNGHWPHQIYVREARRMVGAYVHTEWDCRRYRIAEDSVGLGSYNMDSHNVQRYITPDGFAQNEGNIEVSPGGPYAISYRAITPRQTECENLLVPVCVSSSHIAFGSIRMEPVFMILGQSAATAAALANQGGIPVQEVPYEQLAARLKADGQFLEIPGTFGPHPPQTALLPEEIDGIVLLPVADEAVGEWRVATHMRPYIGEGYWVAEPGADDEAAAVTFAVPGQSPEPGRYEVLLAYTAHTNRNTAVQVAIHGADGVTEVTIDQRQLPRDGYGLFHSLGTHELDASPRVTVTAAPGSGVTIADALWLRRVE